MGRRPRRQATPDIAGEIAEVLRTEYRDLYLLQDGDNLLVRGQFPVSDERGTLDRFAIEISVDLRDPAEVPLVREVGGRIPRTPERHINPDDTACVGVPEEWLVVRPDASFATFMSGPVRNFFIGQALVERGLPWPTGERSHGIAGAIEAFGELVGFTDRRQLVNALKMLTKAHVGGHLACPCGSGLILRKCHLDTVRSAQARIKPEIGTLMLRRLGIPRW